MQKLTPLLWLLGLGLMALTPLVGLGQTASAIYDIKDKFADPWVALAAGVDANSYATSIWCVFAMFTALRIAAGYRILKDFRWSTVQFTLAVLWVGSIVELALGLFFARRYLSISDEATFEFAAKGLVSILLVSGTWTVYLVRSHRVRITYPKVV